MPRGLSDSESEWPEGSRKDMAEGRPKGWDTNGAWEQRLKVGVYLLVNMPTCWWALAQIWLVDIFEVWFLRYLLNSGISCRFLKLMAFYMKI